MRRIIFVFALFVVFVLAACGRGRHAVDENNNYNGSVEYISGVDSRQGDQPTRTLTILATYCEWSSFVQESTPTRVLGTAEREIQQIWRDRNETLNVEVELVRWNDFQAMEARNQRLSIQMMAGDAPDIIIVNRQNILPMAEQGFLVNFYDLIDQDPYLSRDDFFTQALSAFEISGRLYMLPTSFGFEYVGINAHLPQHIIDEFVQKSFITVDEMMDLYLMLTAVYNQEFGHLILGLPTTWDSRSVYEGSFGGLTSPLAMESGILFESIIGNYVNLDTKVSDIINSRFISSLEAMREIFEKDFTTPAGLAATRILNRDLYILINDNDMRVWTNAYMFGIKGHSLNPIHAFITPITPQFIHHIPLVDNQGRLLISSNPINDGGSSSTVSTKICITAGADIDLAWEFVQHMLEICNTSSHDSLATPILREHFSDQLRISIDRALGHARRPNFEGRGDFEQHRLIRDNALQRIAAYNEMPMALLTTEIPCGLYEENLDLFLRGIMPIDDFIQQLHNSVTLWLIE